LKSPSVKSGIGRCFALRSVITFAQKFACLVLSLGAYIFNIVAIPKHLSSYLN